MSKATHRRHKRLFCCRRTRTPINGGLCGGFFGSAGSL
nr:MAG TPA: hypothetical protein [Caudoviricetes sp.]